MVLGLLFELNLLCHCRDLQGKSRPCFCSPIHGKRRLWIVVGPRPSSEHLHLGSNSGDMDRQYERRLVEDPWIDTWGQGSAGTCWRHKVLHPSCCTCSSAINRECNEWQSSPYFTRYVLLEWQKQSLVCCFCWTAWALSYEISEGKKMMDILRFSIKWVSLKTPLFYSKRSNKKLLLALGRLHVGRNDDCCVLSPCLGNFCADTVSSQCTRGFPQSHVTGGKATFMFECRFLTASLWSSSSVK